MITSTIANIFGLVGSFFIVSAYGYNTYSSKVKEQAYHSMNLFGSSLLVVSLTVHFNLPSMLLQLTWILIALGGLFRFHKPNKKLESSNNE